MPRGRHAPVSRGRGPKRQVTWVGPADQAYITVASTTKVIIAFFRPEITVPSIDKATIVRTRGQVSITFDSFAADKSIVGAYGAGIVSFDAFTAGVASVPGPFSDADWGGWYLWRSFTKNFEFFDATGSLLGSSEQEVDSKAMRKIGTSEVMVFVAESQSGAFNISMPLRTLIKLS